MTTKPDASEQPLHKRVAEPHWRTCKKCGARVIEAELTDQNGTRLVYLEPHAAVYNVVADDDRRPLASYGRGGAMVSHLSVCRGETGAF